MLQDPDLIIHRLRQRYLTQIQDDAGFRVLRLHEPARHKATAFKIAGGDLKIFERCTSPDISTHAEGLTSRFGNGRYASESTSERPGIAHEVSSSTIRARPVAQEQTSTFDGLEETGQPSMDAFEAELYKDHNLSDQSDFSDSGGSVTRTHYSSKQKHVLMMNLHKKVTADPKGKQVLNVRRRGISDASVSYRNLSIPMVPKIAYTEPSAGEFKPSSQSLFSDELSALADEHSNPDPDADSEIGLQGAPTSPNIMNYHDAFSRNSMLAAVDDSELSASEGEATTHERLSKPDARSKVETNENLDAIHTPPLISKRLVPRTIAPSASGLSLLINAKQNTHTDPLEARFGALDGKAEPKPLMLKLYRPTGANPSKPFSVCIKPSATVFETIGFVLLKYLESEQQPPLTEEQRDPDCWTLRIVEDDGELDEDFPALDRTRPISKFSFDEFALVEATPAQIEEYKQTQGTSTPTKSARQALVTTEHLPPPDPAFLSPERSSHSGPSSLSSARPGAIMGPSTKTFAKAPGTPVLLKVKLAMDTSQAHQQEQSTILNVTTETYLGDVLDQVCRRRNLDKHMYSLRLAGANVIVPTDRTIESLQGRTELVLIRKRAKDILHDPGMPRSMTPNAPIVAAPFAYSASKLGTSAVMQSDASSVHDFVNANTYQRWIVWRRQPMSFMGRHERMLAIDGEYVHISPTESKTMFENAKTSSLHVGQIVVCKQSRRLPINFKIIIIKQGQTKRYDFEASSVKESEVIVSKIRTLMRNTQVTRRLY